MPRPRKIVVADNHSWMVRWFDQELRAQQSIDPTLTDARFCEQVGVSRSTIANWRKRHMPTLDNFDAALRALGYRLKIVENDEADI